MMLTHSYLLAQRSSLQAHLRTIQGFELKYLQPSTYDQVTEDTRQTEALIRLKTLRSLNQFHFPIRSSSEACLSKEAVLIYPLDTSKVHPKQLLDNFPLLR